MTLENTPSVQIGIKPTDDYKTWKQYWYAKLYGMSSEFYAKWRSKDEHASSRD